MSAKTAIHEAVKAGDFNAVKTLVNSGADVNHDDVNLGTAVYQAIETFSQDTLKYLLEEAGADVNGQIFANQFTPLMAAVVHNNPPAFDLIIANPGVDVNAKNKEGETPLMFAIKHSKNKYAEKIINHADFEPKVLNNRTRTALMKAVVAENEAIVKMILGHYLTDAAFESDMRESALMLSAQCKNKKITAAVEDAVLPHFNTTIGRALKAKKMREHCERLYILKLREVEDISTLKVDDKWLSWKGRVESARDRTIIMEMLIRLQKDPDMFNGPVAVAVAISAGSNYVQGKVDEVPFATSVV